MLAGLLQAQPAAAEKTLELPTMKITGARELPPPESWQYAQVEGFEVLSNASASETNRMLKAFQRFRRMIEIAWPAAVADATPASLVLCGRKDKFDDFVPPGALAGDEQVSLYLHDRERSAIVLDLQAGVVTPSAGSALMVPGQGVFQTGVEVDSVRQLQREYVRFLLARSRFQPPAWLVEGFTQIVMDIEFTDRWVICGKLPKTQPVGGTGATGGDDFDASAEVGDLPFNAALQLRVLMPLEKLFAVAADDPMARDPLGQSLWAKQAYAFVHLCMFRADGKLAQPFAQFIQRLQHEKLDELLFRECFGLSYGDMDAELRGYIAFTQYKYRTSRLDKEARITATDTVLRAATEAEIGRIKGDAQRLAGRRSDALVSYRAAYMRGEREPALLAALGTEEMQDGEPARARQFLEAAAKLGTDRPSAYVALAKLRLDEARAKPAAGDKLSAAQTAAVLEPLFRARALKPALPGTYQAMATAWTLSVVVPTPAHIGVLEEGVGRFPTDADLSGQTAQLYVRAGDPAAAAKVARLGLRHATDEATRRRFEAFLPR